MHETTILRGLKVVKIVAMNFIEDQDGDDILVVEYQNGSIDDAESYTYEVCNSYEVEFKYKGINFYQDFIFTALTYYFHKNYKELKDKMNRDYIDNIFEVHQKYRNSNKPTDIKTITINYAQELLSKYKY
jgi:hypothetical protein